MGELLCASDLTLMHVTVRGLSNKFFRWKEDFENKVLNVDLGKTKMMVSGSNTKDGFLRVRLSHVVSAA